MGMITQLVKNYDNALQAGANFYNAYNNANGLVEVIENHLLNDANVSEEISGAIVTGTAPILSYLPESWKTRVDTPSLGCRSSHFSAGFTGRANIEDILK